MLTFDLSAKTTHIGSTINKLKQFSQKPLGQLNSNSYDDFLQ